MFRTLLLAVIIANMTVAFAAPPAAKSKIKLGGVSLGMTTAELQKEAKKRRRKLQGPGKGLISMEEMVYIQEFTIAKEKQLEAVSGAKTQTIMLLDDKIVAVKLHFRSDSNVKSYLKTFEKAGFTKENDHLYTGTIDVGDYAGRKVKVKVHEMKISRKTKYDVIISCLEVLGKGMTAEKLQEAQRGGGMRKGTTKGSTQPDGDSRKGMGGVL